MGLAGTQLGFNPLRIHTTRRVFKLVAKAKNDLRFLKTFVTSRVNILVLCAVGARRLADAQQQHSGEDRRRSAIRTEEHES